MIIVRRSGERRHITHWNQNSWMAFGRENKDDPLKNGFGILKTFNEVILAPGPEYTLSIPKNMKILTLVQDGAMIFSSPSGKAKLLERGDLHRINLDSTPQTYTFKALASKTARFFQCGFPNDLDLPASVSLKKIFTQAERDGVLKLIASPNGSEASIKIKQEAKIYSTVIHKGNHIIHELNPGRTAWLHVIDGQILMERFHLLIGDGVGFTDKRSVSFTAEKPSEILLFDLALK